MLGSGLDVTGLAIILGTISILALALVQAMRQGSVKLLALVMAFLAVVGVVGGGHLIWAAFLGDPSQLPTAWREYVAVAGVIAIGLGVQHLVRTLQNSWERSSGEAVSD